MWQPAFDTPTKVQYPHLFTQKVTRQSNKGARETDKECHPLVPEYHRVVGIRADKPAPENSKQLPPHFSGVEEPEEADENESTATRRKNPLPAKILVAKRAF